MIIKYGKKQLIEHLERELASNAENYEEKLNAWVEHAMQRNPTKGWLWKKRPLTIEEVRNKIRHWEFFFDAVEIRYRTRRNVLMEGLRTAKASHTDLVELTERDVARLGL